MAVDCWCILTQCAVTVSFYLLKAWSVEHLHNSIHGCMFCVLIGWHMCLLVVDSKYKWVGTKNLVCWRIYWKSILCMQATDSLCNMLLQLPSLSFDLNMFDQWPYLSCDLLRVIQKILLTWNWLKCFFNVKLIDIEWMDACPRSGCWLFTMGLVR